MCVHRMMPQHSKLDKVCVHQARAIKHYLKKIFIGDSSLLRSPMHGVLESELNSGKAVKLKKIEPNSGRAVKLITSRCLHSLAIAAIDAPGPFALYSTVMLIFLLYPTLLMCCHSC